MDTNNTSTTSTRSWRHICYTWKWRNKNNRSIWMRKTRFLLPSAAGVAGGDDDDGDFGMCRFLRCCSGNAAIFLCSPQLSRSLLLLFSSSCPVFRPMCIFTGVQASRPSDVSGVDRLNRFILDLGRIWVKYISTTTTTIIIIIEIF